MTLGERYRQHLKEPSPIHVHSLQVDTMPHQTISRSYGREDQHLPRTIKIYIKVDNPTLNRNIGKFNLNDILDRVLLHTPGLKINSSKGHVHAQSIPTNGHL